MWSFITGSQLAMTGSIDMEIKMQKSGTKWDSFKKKYGTGMTAGEKGKKCKKNENSI